MSWPREIRPVPIAPTVIRLLGAFLPKTVEGTMDGKPLSAIDEAMVVLTEDEMNFRRVTMDLFSFFMVLDFTRTFFNNLVVKICHEGTTSLSWHDTISWHELKLPSS
jgi:hypothetical protein